MKKLVIIALTVCLSTVLSAQSRLLVDSIFIPSSGTMLTYTVLLPAAYDSSRRYPLLFLLHGYGGTHSDWTSRTELSSVSRDIPLIVVMPDAGNSWYVNSISDPAKGIERALLFDLTSHVVKRYAVDTTRQAIAGLSMGGYGAITIALRHPHRFRFAGSLSGAISVPGDIDLWEHRSWGKRIAPNLQKVFGDGPNRFRDAHDPFLLLTNDTASSFPYLYFVMGTNDGFEGFLPAHRRFTDSLRTRGLPYEYHEIPGGHSWGFWNDAIGPMIRRMMGLLN